jgi:hypothetical protein
MLFRLYALTAVLSLYANKGSWSNPLGPEYENIKTLYCGNDQCRKLIKECHIEEIPWGDIEICQHCLEASIFIEADTEWLILS